jgi:hypothetical protein
VLRLPIQRSVCPPYTKSSGRRSSLSTKKVATTATTTTIDHGGPYGHAACGGTSRYVCVCAQYSVFFSCRGEFRAEVCEGRIEEIWKERERGRPRATHFFIRCCCGRHTAFFLLTHTRTLSIHSLSPSFLSFLT